MNGFPYSASNAENLSKLHDLFTRSLESMFIQSICPAGKSIHHLTVMTGRSFANSHHIKRLAPPESFGINLAA
jgi:hypothetical protein